MTQNPTFGIMDPYDPHMAKLVGIHRKTAWSNFLWHQWEKAVLLTVISTKAYTLLRNILAPHWPEKPEIKEYPQLVEAQQSHLDPKPIVIAKHSKLHCKNQCEGESIAQYVAELRKLSEHYAFRDYLDHVLCDRLICGFTSEAMQKQLLT